MAGVALLTVVEQISPDWASLLSLQAPRIIVRLHSYSLPIARMRGMLSAQKSATYDLTIPLLMMNGGKSLNGWERSEYAVALAPGTRADLVMRRDLHI